MFRKTALPLLLLLFLGGALVNSNSNTDLEERVQKLEAMLRGEQRIERLSVGGLTVQFSVEAAHVYADLALFESVSSGHVSVYRGARHAALNEGADGVSLDPNSVSVVGGSGSSSIHASGLMLIGEAPSILVGDRSRYHTRIGVTETVSSDGTAHKSSAAKITLLDPDGKVIVALP